MELNEQQTRAINSMRNRRDLMVSASSGRCYIEDGQEKIPAKDKDVLLKNGLIEKYTESGQYEYYLLTDKGKSISI